MITFTFSVLVQLSGVFVLVFTNGVNNLTLLPKNPVVCTSQNITLTCRDPGMNGTALYFAIPHVDDTNITNINGTKVNENAYELTLYNISADYNNQLIMCCKDNCSDPSSVYDNQILKVYAMPEPVNNFSCVVYNWLETMNCSWNLAFPQSAGATVSLYWKIPNFTQLMPCPHNINTTHCFWNSTKAGDFSKKTIHFEVVVSSKCGINATSNYTVNTYKIVKLAPVLDLSSNADNSSCATLTWKTGRNEHGKIHFVNYTSKWGNGKKTVHDTEATRLLPKNMTVCDLHPYTTYTFTVQVMPLGTGYLSDPVTTTVQTLQDIPAAGPKVKDGGYMWNPKECNQGNDHELVVYIYWKLPPDESENGVLKQFRLEFDPMGLVIEVAANFTHTEVMLKCNINHTVNIFTCNEAGLSKNKSSLHIPKAQTAVQPQFIVEMSNKTSKSRNVYITWKYWYVEAKGYTVFWCRKYQGNCMINKSIDWIDYESNVTEINIPSGIIMNPEDYLYGVAMNTEHGSGGLSWQSCVYTRHVAPERMPENVIVTNGPYDNSLEIRWDKLTCGSGQPFISTYRVEMCQRENVPQCKERREWEIYSNDNRLLVKNLDAQQQYFIKVQGVTSDKLQGPWSQPVSGQPVDKSLKKGTIAGIVLACLFVLILVLAGSVCIFRHCLKTGKKKWNVSINVPASTEYGNFESEPKTCDRQHSQDSGFPEDLSISPSPKESKQYNLPSDYVQAATNGISEEEPSDLESIEVDSNAFLQETTGEIPEGNLSDILSTSASSEAYVLITTNTTPKVRAIDTDGIGEPGKAPLHVAYAAKENQLSIAQLFDGKLPNSKMAVVSAAGLEATIDKKMNSANVVNTGNYSEAHLVNTDEFKCHSLNNSHLNELDSLGNKNNNSSHPIAIPGQHFVPDYIQVCSNGPKIPIICGHAATTDSTMNAGWETFKSQIDNENVNNVFSHWKQNSSESSSWPEVDSNSNYLDSHAMANDGLPVAPAYVTMDADINACPDFVRVRNDNLGKVVHGTTVSSQLQNSLFKSQNSDYTSFSNGNHLSTNSSLKSQSEFESSPMVMDKCNTSLKLNIVPSITEQNSDCSHSQADQKNTEYVTTTHPFSVRSPAFSVTSLVTASASSAPSPISWTVSSVSSPVSGIASSVSASLSGIGTSVSSPVTHAVFSLSSPVTSSNYITLQSVTSLAPVPGAVKINTDYNISSVPSNNDASNTIENSFCTLKRITQCHTDNSGYVDSNNMYMKATSPFDQRPVAIDYVQLPNNMVVVEDTGTDVHVNSKDMSCTDGVNKNIDSIAIEDYVSHPYDANNGKGTSDGYVDEIFLQRLHVADSNISNKCCSNCD